METRRARSVLEGRMRAPHLWIETRVNSSFAGSFGLGRENALERGLGGSGGFARIGVLGNEDGS